VRQFVVFINFLGTEAEKTRGKSNQYPQIVSHHATCIVMLAKEAPVSGFLFLLLPAPPRLAPLLQFCWSILLGSKLDYQNRGLGILFSAMCKVKREPSP